MACKTKPEKISQHNDADFSSKHKGLCVTELNRAGAEVFSDAVVALHIINYYAEHYVERFTVTPCSEELVTTHNVSLRIRGDFIPGM